MECFTVPAGHTLGPMLTSTDDTTAIFKLNLWDHATLTNQLQSQTCQDKDGVRGQG